MPILRNTLTMNNTKNIYNQYVEYLQKVADIKYSIAVLQWDQETYMPSGGTEARAKQIATLSEMAHKLLTNVYFANILQELLAKNDLSEVEQMNVNLSWEDYSKQKKYSASFVRKLSELTSVAFNKWVDARAKNNFSIFLPSLQQLVNLKKQETNILGYNQHPYDALLNEHEKGCTVNFLDRIFQEIEQPLTQLLALVQSLPEIDNSFLFQHFDKDKQWEWGIFLLDHLGFDFNAGRQDISEHPFTTNFSARDVRITTRVDERDFGNMTWSCLHELGHALYEQGLPNEQYGLPCGEYTSLSIHESQSRFWENNIGRSLGFWQHYYPILKQYFPNQLQNISLDKFYKGINKIVPSFIRTEADELTYHFHVKIRYDIEKDLMTGECNVKDVPSIWNIQYKKYLGVTVKDDKQGCLQDVHWSHGSFGYFPTYSLGSFYAAQFYNFAKKDIFCLEDDLSKGNTEKILSWLRKNIHCFGRRYNSHDLCEKITGKGLDTSHFLNYLSNKINNINQY